jgi:hypothetical protein
VKVSVEFPADINQGNNNAQNNFFDVQTTLGPHVPLRFLLGNPYRRVVEAELVLDKLPDGYRAQLRDSEVAFGKPFRLKPEEVRVVTILFDRPEDLEDQSGRKGTEKRATFSLPRTKKPALSGRLA